MEETTKQRQSRTRRLASVTAPARSRLSHLIRSYYPTLLGYEALYERYQTLEPAFSPDWFNFMAATTERRLHRMLTHTPLAHNGIANLLADLNDYPDVNYDRAATPTEQLKEFVSLARTVGLTSVQFLVDRLDEFLETTNDPQAQADILEPLLAHLLVLEAGGVAFKFFLAQETRDILITRPKIRRDRFTDQAVTVAWNEDQLRYMLKERLTVYSNEKVRDLTPLCHEIWVNTEGEAPCLLAERIEIEMVVLAKGSPRHLLIAAQLLCQTHVRTSGPVGQLEQKDWEAAKVEFRQRIPPPPLPLPPPPPPLLSLYLHKRIALIGEQEKKLTPLEHKILLALANANGVCDRERLVDAAWGTTEGVTDAAVDRAIAGLRKKLGDHSSHSIYLRTERGEGFELMNYEAVD